MTSCKIEIAPEERCTFNLSIEAEGRILLDTTIDAVGTDENIQKARRTVARLLGEYTPAVQSKAPDPSTKGMLYLHCKQCGSTFGMFLREEQSAAVCRCGQEIDLTSGLLPYRYVCPQCKKVRYGKTNIPRPSAKIACACGRESVLLWDQKAAFVSETEAQAK